MKIIKKFVVKWKISWHYYMLLDLRKRYSDNELDTVMAKEVDKHISKLKDYIYEAYKLKMITACKYSSFLRLGL